MQDGRRQTVAGQVLCRIDELPQGRGRGFRFGAGIAAQALFVVKKDDAIYAFVDACPHMGTPLAFLPGQFFDRDGRHLLCSTHGARFRVEDGFCISGPCAGKSLRPVAIRLDAGVIILAETLSVDDAASDRRA